MADYVIILGAGASAPYGIPVMRSFLDKARELYSSGRISPKHEGAFGSVFEAIANLQRVHSKITLDITNLESVFTTFETAIALNTFPGLSHSQINQLPDDLRQVIVSTIEHSTLPFPLNEKGAMAAPEKTIPFRGRDVQMSGLGTLLRKLSNKAPNAREPTVAFITFNYDLLVETMMAVHGIEADYGLKKTGPTPESSDIAIDQEKSRLPLLKLHGSVNWLRTRKTASVVPFSVFDYIRNPDSRSHDPLPASGPRQRWQPERLPSIGDLVKENARERYESLLPVIIPPSWNKAKDILDLQQVWARAAKELAEASSVFVVGYSLPITDTFFQQLLALGTTSDVLIKRFAVYDLNEGPRERFRSLLGPGALNRFSFEVRHCFSAFDEIYEIIKSENYKNQ